MKRIILLVSVFLTGCVPQLARAQALAPSNTEYPTSTRLITATATSVPTIDYQSTAIVAQATADEARRINAMATAEYVALLNEQLKMTAEIERQEFERDSWTATAALISIPLTSTQQAVLNVQVPTQQALISAQLTATKNAPTQIVAMVNAQNYQRYGKADYVLRMIFLASIAFFAIGITIYLLRQPVPQSKPVAIKQPVKTETVVWIKDQNNGGATSTRFVLPCTPDQLTEFAEQITQGRKTLAINNWEGAGTSFSRDAILKVRSWLRDNGFASQTGDGQLAPTNELLAFLIGWLDTRQLPVDYQFGEEKPA